jgi:hypothetical protein
LAVCKIHGVDGFAAEGRIHHQRRKGRLDRVAGHAIHLGGRIDLVHAVGFEQRACGDLAGCGLFAEAGRSEGEGRSGAQAEHTGDDAGLAHADADDGRIGLVFHALKKTHEGQVVGQRARGGDDLDELRLERLDPRVDGVEIFGGMEVVVAHDDGRAGVSQQGHRIFRELFDQLQLDVDKLEAGGGGLE